MNVKNIKALQITLASPEEILKWARGTKVTKPETINYKSQKPEPDGLFCEKIFGPTKDYACYCGKYTGKAKYKNTVKFCEKCGVEIIESDVRRERMSCIELAYPCTHTWMSHELPNPSKISLLLGMTYREVEQVIYFVNYVVIKNPTKLFYKPCEIIPLATDAKGNTEAREKLIEALEEVLKKIEKETTAVAKSSGRNTEKLSELKDEHEIVSQYKMALNDTSLPFSIHTVFDILKRYLGIEVNIGSEAIQQLLREIDVDDLLTQTETQLKGILPASPKFNKIMNKLQLLKWFKKSKIKPEWMVLKYVPVTPPDSRPMVQLENGRFTTSDLNTFYRKIIIRNERLKKMMADGTPTIILQNECRMLQESVDALFDNASRSKPQAKDKRPLKSLTDHLKGKQGLFRQNLLGKRVDYSGRSVIVVGPWLKMYQAGIPAQMALELFKPYIVHQLIRKFDDDDMPIKPIANNIKTAEKMILNQDDTIWPILDKIIKEHPILLNRAPTLHRLGVQAFEPKIVDGKAIRLHPLVTTAFNADFDGDQMGVYVPLSKEAIAEARSILLASWHILGPKDGKPIITPTQDMILGTYYISQEEKGLKGEGLIFANPLEVRKAYETHCVDLHAIIGITTNAYDGKGLASNSILVTSVGKVLFNSILPETMTFVNDGKDVERVAKERILAPGTDVRKAIAEIEPMAPFTKKTLQSIVNVLYKKFPVEIVAKTMDAIKDTGFDYSTKSSVTISAFDLPPYDKKLEYFKEADKDVARYWRQFNKGLLTDDERYKRVIDRWYKVKDEVTKDIVKILHAPENANNPVIIMANSGARGNESQFTQLLGMRGLMSKSYNYDQKTKSNVIKDTIETPIKHSLLDGLTIAEYFNNSYGARKGMADTAMKTSKSGYMTRKLVDAAQEVIVSEEDCGTPTGLVVKKIEDTKQNYVIETLADRIANRFAFEDIIDPKSGKLLVAKNEIITPEMADKIENKYGIEEVVVRSVLHCKCKNGICQKCFGNDLTTNKPVEIGTAIGVIAAQSIGEPGTQINMRTFHTGGVASSTGSMAQGFERLKQLFDLVPPNKDNKEIATIATISGVVSKVQPYEEGTKIVIRNDISKEEVEYNIGLSGAASVIRVEKGDVVQAGDKLTDGNINIKVLLEVAGVEAVREYLLKEVQKVYRLQGIEISDKYVEIIIRQLTNKLKITNPGDSEYFMGEITEINDFTDVCQKLFAKGKELPMAKNVIYGLDDVATSKSGPFLAAASFQDTKKILTDACIRGDVDELSGLKENVMIGNLIPAGTGNQDPEDIIKLGDEMYKKEY